MILVDVAVGYDDFEWRSMMVYVDSYAIALCLSSRDNLSMEKGDTMVA